MITISKEQGNERKKDKWRFIKNFNICSEDSTKRTNPETGERHLFPEYLEIFRGSARGQRDGLMVTVHVCKQEKQGSGPHGPLCLVIPALRRQGQEAQNGHML